MDDLSCFRIGTLALLVGFAAGCDGLADDAVTEDAATDRATSDGMLGPEVTRDAQARAPRDAGSDSAALDAESERCWTPLLGLEGRPRNGGDEEGCPCSRPDQPNDGPLLAGYCLWGTTFARCDSHWVNGVDGPCNGQGLTVAQCAERGGQLGPQPAHYGAGFHSRRVVDGGQCWMPFEATREECVAAGLRVQQNASGDAAAPSCPGAMPPRAFVRVGANPELCCP